jgi:hypothetical protein
VGARRPTVRHVAVAIAAAAGAALPGAADPEVPGEYIRNYSSQSSCHIRGESMAHRNPLKWSGWICVADGGGPSDPTTWALYLTPRHLTPHWHGRPLSRG